MAQVLVRQLDDKLVERLKKTGQRTWPVVAIGSKDHFGRSGSDYEGAWKRIAKLKKTLERAGRTFSDSTPLIREERDRCPATWWMRVSESSDFSLKFTLKESPAR